MTPGIEVAKKAGIRFVLHEYQHDPTDHAWGEEAARKLQVPASRVFKTLVVVASTGTLAVGVVPVSSTMNLKNLAKTLGVRKVEMADVKLVERTTGYVLGGVSPLGQKKALQTVIDDSALEFETIYVSAGRRGLEIECAAEDIAQLTRGQFSPISQQDRTHG